MIHAFFQIVLMVKETVDLPLSASKITTDVSDWSSFKAFRSSLERLSLGGLEF